MNVTGIESVILGVPTVKPIALAFPEHRLVVARLTTDQSLTAAGGRRSVALAWAAGGPAPTGGQRIYYVQAGKLQFRAGVALDALSFKDTGLSRGTQYTYVVTAWTDCNGNRAFDPGVDTESPPSNEATATAQ